MAFAVPGDLDTPTGGYRYDRALIAGLRALGHPVEVTPLPESFPNATDADRSHAMAVLQAVPRESALVVDGLAYGVLAADGLAMLAAPFVALCHHPLALETGLDASEQAALLASERAALAVARHVVVTSPHTKTILSDELGVEAERVTVAVPGLSGKWRKIENRPSAPARIVSVGSLTRRKGYDVLVDALAALTDIAFRCDIVGSPHHDPDTAKAIARQVADRGLADRITLHGALCEEEIVTLYQDAAVFALATRYEGFGMVFAEALAAGLPVVGTTAGAVPSVVPRKAGLLVAPDDPPALAAALRTVLTDASVREELAAGAREVGSRFGGWDETASIVSGVVEAL